MKCTWYVGPSNGILRTQKFNSILNFFEGDYRDEREAGDDWGTGDEGDEGTKSTKVD